MHVAGRQVNHVTGLQGKMVQKKGNEDAGISGGEGFIDVHHGGQRFAVRLQRCAGGQDGDYLVDGVGDAGATLDESAEGCFQAAGSSGWPRSATTPLMTSGTSTAAESRTWARCKDVLGLSR